MVTSCVAQQCVVLRKLTLYANVRATRFPESTIVSLFQSQKGQFCSSQFVVKKKAQQNVNIMPRRGSQDRTLFYPCYEQNRL